MQQLSGSSGRGGTLIPSTVLIFSAGGAGLEAGPASLDPKIIFWIGGVGDFPAPVVRPDSSSMREAICSCFSFSLAVAFALSVIAGKGLSTGLCATGCCMDTTYQF